MSGCSTSSTGWPRSISSATVSTSRSVTYSSTIDCSVKRRSAFAALHQRPSPQRLDRLDDRAPTDARRHGPRELCQADRLALDRQPRQNVALHRRESLDLDVQQPADAPEDRAVAGDASARNARDVAVEDLANRLAHDLQRQAVAAVAVHQTDPRLRVAGQLLVGQQRLSLGDAKAVQLQRACSGDRAAPAPAGPRGWSAPGSSGATFRRRPAAPDRSRPCLLDSGPRAGPARTASRSCRAPAGSAVLAAAAAAR